jgi:beta-lactamase regulating signal transducer with metallopeptidase domain
VTTLAALLGALLLKPALVLGGAAAAITTLLRRRTAAARHAVWAGAILASLALPLLSRVLPPLRLSLPAPFAGLEAAFPLPERLSGSGPAAGNALAAARLRGVPSRGVPDRSNGAVGEDPLARAIMALWILGVLVLLVRRVGAEVRVHRILRRARPASDPRLETLFSHLAGAAGIRRPVQLRVGEEIASPVVAGVFRPVVLLPTAAVTWAKTELSAVLIHELGHVRRRDCLLNLFADLARTIYWCNPVVRLAARRMRSESESACDDLVLRQGIEPEGYAQLLLGIARTARRDGGVPSAAVAMARPRELESRLLDVLDPRVPRNALPRWTIGALAGLGVVLALPAAAFTLHAAAPQTSAPLAPEPDRLGDSLAGPSSERLRFTPDPKQLSRHVAQALRGPDSALAHRLVMALGHQPTDQGDLVRDRAAWALSQVRDGRLIEPLLEALSAPDWRAQAYAAWALAAARDRRATSLLVPLLAHPVWRLRAMAAFVLRQSGDPEAQAAMDTALTDPAWQVRVEAVEYFATLGGATLSERLRPRLFDRHVAVRHAAEVALTSR